LSPRHRGLNYLGARGTRLPGHRTLHGGTHYLARKDVRDKNNALLCAAEAEAAVDEFFYCKDFFHEA
jgi:hypothetical protein